MSGLELIHVYSLKRLIPHQKEIFKMSLFSEVIGFSLNQRQGDTPLSKLRVREAREGHMQSITLCTWHVFVTVVGGPPQDLSNSTETSTGNQSYENVPGEWF